MRKAGELVKAGSSFLTLQMILQFPSFGDGHCFARPSEYPWTFPFGPFGDAFVVLGDSDGHIFGHADVKPAFGILNHIDAVHGACEGQVVEEQRTNKELVAGAGFEPATFRL